MFRIRLFITCSFLGLITQLGWSQPSSKPTADGETVYLVTDRHHYKPREIIYFSAFVLNDSNRFQSGKYQLKTLLLNAKGQAVDSSLLPVVNGRVGGRLNIPNAGGRYTIKALTPWQLNYPDEHYFSKDIFVQQFIERNFFITSKFQHDTYHPGDQVELNLTFRTVDERPIDQANYQWELIVNNNTIQRGTARTDRQGKGIIEVGLPAYATENTYLSITSTYQANLETYSARVPVQSGKTKVITRMATRGSALVAGVTNTIVVESLDGNGLPVTIHAALKDKSNTLIDSVVTSYKGMASIDFTPHLENRYHLEFTHADATAGRVDLVEPASRGNIIWFKHLNSGLEVHVGPHAANHTLVISGSGSIVQTHRINRDVLDLFIPKNELKEGVLSVALYSGNDLREHRLTFVRPVEPEVDLMMRGDRMDLQSSVNGKIQWSFKEYGSLNYTLRVINTQYLNQIRDHGHSMRSWLWLGDEFNTDMEDGDDYFKTDEDAYAYTQLYVDTYRNRWRRDPANGKMIAREDVIYPRGVVNFNGYLKSIRDYSQPIDRARLRIKGTNVETFSDSMGHFEFINVPSQWMSEEYITLIISKGLERFEYIIPNSYYYFSNSFSPTSGVARSNGDLGLLSPILKGIEQASPSYKSLLRTSMVTQPTSPYYNKNAVRDYSINESNMMSLDLACVSRIIYLYQQPFAYQNDYPPSNSYYDPYAVLLTPSRIRLSPIDMNDRDMNSAIKYWRPNGMAERGNEPFTFSSGYTEGGYTIICEGVTGTGNPFKVEKSFHVQDAVTIDAKSPLTASFGDTISYRILVSNHADSSLTIDLTYGIDEKIESTLRLNPDETKELRYIWVAPDSTIYLNLIVDGRFSGRTKRFTRPVQVIERGHSRKEFLTVTNTTTKTFPIESMLMDRFIIRLETIENFSKMLNQTAASMIRQPHGCFEQVSSSNYPNILAARILSESSNASQILYEQAMRALQDGYKRLAAYETSEGGFEWYGRNPPHESLTAYGLLQFHLMQQVGIQVDQKLLERTQKWLLSRRDGKGGFKYHPGRYGFSSASYEVNNAYITYVLARTGVKGLQQEVTMIEKDVQTKFDAYKLALLGNIYAYQNQNDRALEILEQLMNHFEDRQFASVEANHSVMRSYNQSLRNECLALTLMLVHQLDPDLTPSAQKLINALLNTKSYYGFGSTQATALTLEALGNYTSIYVQNDQKSTYKLFVNNTPIKEFNSSELNRQQEVVLNHTHVKNGLNSIRIECPEHSTPISVAASWIEVPTTKSHPTLGLGIEYSKTNLLEDELTVMTVSVENKSNDPKPQTVAVVKIPSGLSLNMEELKVIDDNGLVDYYEFNNNVLNLYFLELGPREKKVVNLALTPSVSGHFHTPESRVYQYYTPEIESFTSGSSISITPISHE